jgi:hypothetical protein
MDQSKILAGIGLSTQMAGNWQQQEVPGYLLFAIIAAVLVIGLLGFFAFRQR